MQKSPRRIGAVEGLVDRVGREDGGQRQGTAGQPLREADEIGRDPRLLVGKQAAGAAKAGGNLIDDQVHLVAVAQDAGLAQVGRVVHHHAGGALDQRLHDQGRSLGVVLLEPALQRCGCTQGGVGGRLARQGIARIGAGHGGRQAGERRIRVAENLHIGDRQGAHGFTVVTAGQSHEAVFVGLTHIAPVMGAHLQRDFGGAGAIAAVAGVAQAGQCGQAFGQLHHRRMGAASQHHVVELFHLIGHCSTDVRVAVPEQIDPPGADAVQVAAAIGVVQPGAAGAVNGQRWRGFVPLHGGARVPDGSDAAGSKCGCTHAELPGPRAPQRVGCGPRPKWWQGNAARRMVLPCYRKLSYRCGVHQR